MPSGHTGLRVVPLSTEHDNYLQERELLRRGSERPDLAFQRELAYAQGAAHKYQHDQAALIAQGQANSMNVGMLGQNAAARQSLSRNTGVMESYRATEFPPPYKRHRISMWWWRKKLRFGEWLIAWSES